MNPAVLLFCIAYIAPTHAVHHDVLYWPWSHGSQYSDYEWPLPEVGQGVTVTAKVLYDSTLKSTASSQNEVTEDENEPTLEDFKKLFEQVEAFFHSLSIMIKIEVVSVQQSDSFGVENKPGSLEANFTLEKLKSHVATEQDGNNTITYLFTRKPLYVKETGEEPKDEYTYLGPYKTFCSTLKSAAVVHHDGMNDSANAISATAWIIRECFEQVNTNAVMKNLSDVKLRQDGKVWSNRFGLCRAGFLHRAKCVSTLPEKLLPGPLHFDMSSKMS